MAGDNGTANLDPATAAPANGQDVSLLTNGKLTLGRLGLALVPFTPVPFTGSEALYSWGRVILYGGLSMGLYQRNKALATAFGVAAGVSVLTSLGGTSWNGGEK